MRTFLLIWGGQLFSILGSVDIQEPIVYFATSQKGATAQASFAGNIGMEILRRFRVILDYPRKRVILEKNEHFDEPYDHAMSGMAFTPAGEQMRIELIVEGGPAAEAGLQVGDLITHVNGQRAIDVDILELRQMFRSDTGRHRINVTREGDQYDLMLTPRRLV